MLDLSHLHHWVSLFQNIIQSPLMHLCHRGKISKILLCLMIVKVGLLTCQTFRNNHFHLLISVESATLKVSLYC